MAQHEMTESEKSAFPPPETLQKYLDLHTCMITGHILGIMAFQCMCRVYTDQYKQIRFSRALHLFFFL